MERPLSRERLDMGKLSIAPLSSIAAEERGDEGQWVCEGRLPEGAVLMTGIAGTPCPKKVLQSAAQALFAEYTESWTVEGEPAREGNALYVQLEGSMGRAAKQLGCGFSDEIPDSALACTWPGKMSCELAQAVREAAGEEECGLVVIDGAQTGCEGRQKLSTILAELDRAGKAAGCAVVVVMPLTKRNMFSVKDPSTGIWDACSAVWEVYTDPAGSARCFCAMRAGGATAFDLQVPKAGRKPQTRAHQTVSVEAAAVGGESPEISDFGEEIDAEVDEEGGTDDYGYSE